MQGGNMGENIESYRNFSVESDPTTVTDKYWIYAEAKGDSSLNREPPIEKDIEPIEGLLKDTEKGKNLERTENTIQAFGKELELTRENIDRIAATIGILSGKWLIYREEDKIVSTWNKIRNSVKKGKLGNTAKCSTKKKQRGKGGDYVICVYTLNYLNKKDVFRVRKNLRQIGVSEKLYYKPDIYSILNIYSKNVDFPASCYES
ncbi:hypothetical protein AKJ65_06415 [candidate division MSBL1 archaeon SCGC-AAA259E19]|uniref:DUF1917 domain-containing protein n=1 Tax=candidate division MSBL1 archaeon SCGC-AAA259E19 TaxID=1698264 RepID=A0A133UGS5_9EURY|nr:hypothetical protein AKJ65_06415 [candidate division MSBL1 archaeon SCGC-AAA259E19]